MGDKDPFHESSQNSTREMLRSSTTPMCQCVNVLTGAGIENAVCQSLDEIVGID